MKRNIWAQLLNHVNLGEKMIRQKTCALSLLKKWTKHITKASKPFPSINYVSTISVSCERVLTCSDWWGGIQQSLLYWDQPLRLQWRHRAKAQPQWTSGGIARPLPMRLLWLGEPNGCNARIIKFSRFRFTIITIIIEISARKQILTNERYLITILLMCFRYSGVHLWTSGSLLDHHASSFNWRVF